MQRLLQSKKKIEYYEVLQYGGISYLIYKLQGARKPRTYAVDISHLGDISLSEYILCKEKTLEELMIRCKKNNNNFQKANKKTRRTMRSN